MKGDTRRCILYRSLRMKTEDVTIDGEGLCFVPDSGKGIRSALHISGLMGGV
jgi:hypothetical protein